jgi:prepilin-type N-terminal cleavage/methylation domain-containing protein
MKEFNLISVFKGRTAQSGFTLLEILIAITLLAFITLGVVNITENAALTMERTGEINKNNLQAETAFSRFEWDFSQIYSPLYFSTIMNINNMNINPQERPPDGGDTGEINTGAEATQPRMGMGPGQMSPELQKLL